MPLSARQERVRVAPKVEFGEGEEYIPPVSNHDRLGEIAELELDWEAAGIAPHAARKVPIGDDEG
jgi:hypothetical protein